MVALAGERASLRRQGILDTPDNVALAARHSLCNCRSAGVSPAPPPQPGRCCGQGTPCPYMENDQPTK